MKRICGFEGCDREHSAKGYCFAHYSQVKEGRELTPIRPYHPVGVFSKKGRDCTECGEFKSWNDFYEHQGAGFNGHYSKCKVCFKKKIKERVK